MNYVFIMLIVPLKVLGKKMLLKKIKNIIYTTFMLILYELGDYGTWHGIREMSFMTTHFNIIWCI